MLKKLLIGIPLLTLVGTGTLYGYVNHRARTEVDARMAQMVASGAYQRMDYEDITVQLNGDINLTNLHVANTDGEFILQDIMISNLDYQHEIPWHMDVSISGMQLPRGLPVTAYSGNAALDQFMQTLVVDDALPVQLNYSFRYAPENEFQIDSKVNLHLPQAFTLDVDSITRNIELESFAGMQPLDRDPAIAQLQLQEKLQDLAIPYTSLTLQDHGLVAGMLAMAAEQNGFMPEDLRLMLITQARNAYLFTPQNVQTLAMDTGNHVATFLEGGKTLKVNVEPQFGGDLRQLQQEIMGAVFTGNFAQAVSLLNLEIVAQ